MFFIMDNNINMIKYQYRGILKASCIIHVQLDNHNVLDIHLVL